MVRQHLYRVHPDGGHTVAASASLRDSAWLRLLEQQMEAVDYAALPAPIFYQYPLGRGLVISRCAPDPLSPDGAYLAHQLMLDQMEDMEKLTRIRPLALSHFLTYYLDSAETELPDLLPEALGDETDLNDCLDTLGRLFAGQDSLLAGFLACLSLCARDKRQYIRVTLNDTIENVSMFGRQIMELMLRMLPVEDALRVSFCSLLLPDALNMHYSVCFSPDGGQTLEPAPQEILLSLTEKTLTAGQGVELPESGRFLPEARALLARSVWQTSAADSLPAGMPSFEPGASLKKYFADWRAAMEAQKSALSDSAFQAFAAREWPKLLGAMIAAGEQMDSSRFIIELSGVLYKIRREKLAEPLALTNDTLTDMAVLLLDSIRWRQIDLADTRLGRAVRSACSYAYMLSAEQFPEEELIACRIVHRMLTSPTSILDLLEDMEALESVSPEQFESLQYCLRQYVQNRLNADIDVIDEQLAAAAMLGFAKFADGIPDLRLADKLTEKIEAQIDARSARRFQQMLDKLRRNLRSTHDGMMILRRRDMKLFLFISLLLAGLIGGISIWFLFLS